MPRKSLILFALLLLQTGLLAQTQSGIVKTRGRLSENGLVIPGIPLTGVSVTIQGANTVITGKNGTFKVPLPNQDYYIQSIQKNGYRLVDQDFLRQSHSYSREPLFIVMETPSQMEEDLLAAEKRIRRTLRRQIQEKEDEIERLKEQNRITAEKYRSMYQELYDSHENDADIIRKMAERYSSIDFDQLDSFNEKITSLILEGELTKADSLIQSKGSINVRTRDILGQQAANAREEASLKHRINQLEKKKNATAILSEDLSRDCYTKFEIFYLRHNIDSAAYYLDVRASLDTTNILRLVDVANFAMLYSINYRKAEEAFLKALQLSESTEVKNISDLSSLYSNLGILYNKMGEKGKALDYYEKSIELLKNEGNEFAFLLGSSYNSIGAYYAQNGPFEKGVEYLKEGIEQMEAGEEREWDYNTIAATYNNLGTAYKHLGDYDKAFESFKQSIDLHEKHPSREVGDGEIMTALVNLGSLYSELNQYEEAIPYFERALDWTRERYGERHPKIAACYSELGFALSQMGSSDKGIELIYKAIEINTHFFGEQSESLTADYNNLATVYYSSGRIDLAAEYMEKVLDISKALNLDSSSLGSIYYNCAVLNDRLGNIEKAAEYCQNALDVLDRFVPKDHPFRETVSKRNDLLKEKLAEKERM